MFGLTIQGVIGVVLRAISGASVLAMYGVYILLNPKDQFCTEVSNSNNAKTK
jgi:hypothetical protein